MLNEKLQLINDNDEVEELEDSGFNIFIDPDSKFARWWSIVIILCLVYVATIMPFNLSFVDDASLLLEISDRTVDFFFIMDIIVNFFSAYREDNLLVTSNKKIAKNYIHGWFIFDFVASFPT